MYDVIIVGGGPAGLSAALVLGRSRRRVLLCDDGHPRNVTSQGVNNYLTRDGILPMDLLRHGREEIGRYGVDFRETRVVDASKNEQGFEVHLKDGRQERSRKLLLATGVVDRLPDVEGILDFYGRSVFHCPYCDGWEMQDQPLAVYGHSAKAVGLALNLLTWSRDLVICLDGGRLKRQDRDRIAPYGITVRPEKIVRLEGTGGILERIVFERGDPLPRRGMFFNTGQYQRSELPGRLGCTFDRKGAVCTDSRGRTACAGLFIAGDALGEVQFAITAASEGAKAAVAINRELQDEDRKAEQARPAHPPTPAGEPDRAAG